MEVPCIVTVSDQGIRIELEKDSRIYLEKNMQFSWSQVVHVEEKHVRAAYFYTFHVQNKNFNLNFRGILQLEKNDVFLNAVRKYKKID